MLYKNMVRSHLDYCSSVLSPYMKKDIEALEKVQKRATKLLTLLYRRSWGDMIETYKIQEFVRPRWPYDMRPSAVKYMCVIVIR